MYDDSAKLVLRLAVGFLMLFHGISKLTNGVSGLEGMMQSNGLPSFFAYGVYLGEVLAPLMLIFGIRVRLAAILIIVTMLTAIGMAHADDIFVVKKQGAWDIELQMFYVLASLSILLQGAGRYSIGSLGKN